MVYFDCILDNAHIALDDTRKRIFSATGDEQIQMLHLGDKSKYNSDSDKDFNKEDYEALKAVEKTNIRIFETDKIKELYDSSNKDTEQKD